MNKKILLYPLLLVSLWGCAIGQTYLDSVEDSASHPTKIIVLPLAKEPEFQRIDSQYAAHLGMLIQHMAVKKENARQEQIGGSKESLAALIEEQDYNALLRSEISKSLEKVKWMEKKQVIFLSSEEELDAHISDTTYSIVKIRPTLIVPPTFDYLEMRTDVTFYELGRKKVEQVNYKLTALAQSGAYEIDGYDENKYYEIETAQSAITFLLRDQGAFLNTEIKGLIGRGADATAAGIIDSSNLNVSDRDYFEASLKGLPDRSLGYSMRAYRLKSFSTDAVDVLRLDPTLMNTPIYGMTNVVYSIKKGESIESLDGREKIMRQLP